MWVHSVNESGGVVQMKGTRGSHALGAENGHCEFLAQPTIGAGWEEVCWCINVNHRHSKTVETRTWFDIYVNRRKTCSYGSWNDTRFHLLMSPEEQSDMVTDGGPIG